MSQVRFFMLDDDEREFVEMLRGRGDTQLFLHRFFPTKNPEPLTGVPSFQSAKEITLVNAQLRPNPTCTRSGFGESSGLYLFDDLHDPACEFSRCYFDGSILVDGRLYAKIGWLQSSAENKIFGSWYRSVERWLKKRYRSHRSWWFGPRAEEWSLKGGEVRYGRLVESLQNPKPV